MNHRLIWMWRFGYFPEHEIDHRKGIKIDNRIEEMREVTRTCNMQNCAINTRNTSGFPGVSFCKFKKRFRATVRVNKKSVHLGYYIDVIEAALARYTFEQQCINWNSNERNERNELAKAIKAK